VLLECQEIFQCSDWGDGVVLDSGGGFHISCHDSVFEESVKVSWVDVTF
jgi:hypothetical protein